MAANLRGFSGNDIQPYHQCFVLVVLTGKLLSIVQCSKSLGGAACLSRRMPYPHSQIDCRQTDITTTEIQRDDTDRDIPNIDRHIRSVFNEEPPPRMRKHLEEFLNITGLDEHRDLFNHAMYLAAHSGAYGDNESNSREPELDYAKEEQHANKFPAGAPARSLRISNRDRAALQLDAASKKGPPAARRWRLPNFVKPDTQKWHHLPAGVIHVIVVCGVGATVQGIDQAVVNGAQGLYLAAFHIQDGNAEKPILEQSPRRVGLINAAPYLCCVVSCWFTPWLNHLFGRRGTIMLCALFSIFFAFAQAFAQTWQQLVVFRLLMGLGIGPKSATIPIYAAETAPANIRGSLVTCWQAFTALGIAIGCAFSTGLHQLGAFRKCFPSDQEAPPEGKLANPLGLVCSWNWRVILAIPMLPPIFLALLVYFCRESPRWTVSKAHSLHRRRQYNRAQHYYRKAFRDLNVLSRSPLLAARDMFIHFFFLRREYEQAQTARDNPDLTWIGHKFRQLFRNTRNQRAITASTICMVAQQLW